MSKYVTERRTALPEVGNGSYVYQPLNVSKKQVRIFRLAPGPFGGSVKGSLIVVSLDKLRRRKWQELRQWVALSYVWGTSNRDETLRISQKHILITKTLHRILQHFRSTNKERYLWIDQICINQNDFQERGSQVRLMRDIYSEATQVVAWLGTDMTEIESLLRMINKNSNFYEKQFIQITVTGNVSSQEVSRRKGLVAKTLRLKASDVTLEQVFSTLRQRYSNLFDNAWFKRVWTLQEAVLADNLILRAGEAQAPWEPVTWIFGYLTKFEPSSGGIESTQTGITTIQELRAASRGDRGLYYEKNSTCHIFHLNRRASDPKDYVYGQIGMLNTKVLSFLELDYSAEVESVFMDGTLALINSKKDLSTLGFCCAGHEGSTYTLPSWCLDWSCSSSFCGIYNNDYQYIHNDADPGSRLRAPFSFSSGFHIKRESESSVLCVRGVIIDEVYKVFTGHITNEKGCVEGEEDYKTGRSILRDILSTGPLPSEDGQCRALYRTLASNMLVGIFRETSDSIASIPAWRRALQEGLEMPEVDTRMGYQVHDMKRLIGQVGNGSWPIFKTLGGRFGKSCSMSGKKIKYVFYLLDNFRMFFARST